MPCKHKHLRCTDCRFFCLDCGIELKLDEIPKPEEKPVKTAKKGKRTKGE